MVTKEYRHQNYRNELIIYVRLWVYCMQSTSEQEVQMTKTHQTSHGRHQLLIIGNGFDLACGLKSSYSDFFDERLKTIDTIWSLEANDWKQAVDKNKLTVWDFILNIKIEGTDWCNVEKAIGDWVLPRDCEEYESLIDSLFGILERYPFSSPSPRFINGRMTYGMKVFDLRIRDVSRYIWYKMEYQPEQHMDRSRLLSFLRKELTIIENQFQDYLRRQYMNSTSYLNKAVGLIRDMAFDGHALPQQIEYDKNNTSVLSFNYTTPFKYENNIIDAGNVVNIHGNLDDKIIFGVDGKDCMDDPDALPFTKTYRVASMGVDMCGVLYGIVENGIGQSDTDSIKFFGHSLSEADYSYFQSIFDGINLYGGHTKLVFYYRPWKGKDEEELHTETINAVTRLLTTYGRTLDNKDHGKNLMHKLLLEGRLEVKNLQHRAW